MTASRSLTDASLALFCHSRSAASAAVSLDQAGVYAMGGGDLGLGARARFAACRRRSCASPAPHDGGRGRFQTPAGSRLALAVVIFSCRCLAFGRRPTVMADSGTYSADIPTSQTLIVPPE